MRPMACILLATVAVTGMFRGPTIATSRASVAAQPPATGSEASASTQAVNDRFVRQWAERIRGRENEPAERVFKNIQIEVLKDEPAENFIGIMDGGYAKALGVRCTHCHVEDDFASDDKRPKRAAREMAAMHRGINQQLAKMSHLKSKPDARSINCATCHRGAIDPNDPVR